MTDTSSPGAQPAPPKHVIPSLPGTGQLPEMQRRSCSSCVLRRSHGGQDWCAGQGIPVSLPAMPDDVRAEAFNLAATECGNLYNNSSVPIKPDKVIIDLGVPTRFPEDTSDYVRSRCTSCTTCVHFVRAPETMATVGMPGWGACLARGLALNVDSSTTIARTCSLRERSSDQSSDAQLNGVEFAGMKFNPQYNPEMLRRLIQKRDSQRGVARRTPLPADYDPLTYRTNKYGPVIKECIRTWVDVFDPSGSGNSVALPVFDPQLIENVYGKELRELIPKTGSDEHPEAYEDWAGHLYDLAVLWRGLDESPTLWGAPGVGKTEALRYAAWVMQAPFHRISITNSSELDDLQGYNRLLDGETKFVYGRLAKAWQLPGVICLDEPNTGPRDVWQWIRPLTDNSKQLAVDANQGEVLQRFDHCYLGLAMNPEWDPRNDGTNALADADMRRLAHIWMGLPSNDVEARIIRSHCQLSDGWEPPKELLDMVLHISSDLRSLDPASLPFSWGVGMNIKVTRLLRWFTTEKAYSIAIGNAIDPELRTEMQVTISNRKLV